MESAGSAVVPCAGPADLEGPPLRSLVVPSPPATAIDWLATIRRVRVEPRALARALAGRAAAGISRSLGPGHPFFALPPSLDRPRGSVDRAQGRLARAAALAPDEDLVLEWTARLEAGRGRVREALGLFRRLVSRARSARGRAAGLVGAGEVALARGRVREAVALLRRSLAIHPESPVARARLAVALALLPDPEAASGAFRRLDRESDETPEVLAALGASPAFPRLLDARPEWAGRFREAAPRLLRDPLRESAAARSWIEGVLASAQAWIGRASRRAKSDRRFAAEALARIARTSGYPRGLLLRSGERGAECLASFPRRRPAEERTPTPGPGAEGEDPLSEARVGSPPLTLILRSPHAWRIGEGERRFLEEALERMRERLAGPGGKSPRGWLERLPLRLGGRSACLLEWIPRSGRLRVRDRAGRAVEPGATSIPALLRRGFDASPARSPADPGLEGAIRELAGSVEGSARASLVVPVPHAGAPAGVLIVESSRRDLGDRERTRLEEFAAGIGPRLRAEQFREWTRERFSESAELPAAGAGARLAAALARAARSEGPVLLVGETGTGKEVFARYVHFEGGRASGPFVPYACGRSACALVEAELFGYARGAFTGAERGAAGVLERCAGGTLFLDEVSVLSAETQARLLRVLERGAVRRLGEEAERPTDFRVVASTQVDLALAAREGRFRMDLLHRLARFRLDVPPLRERREEIPALARAFAERFAARDGRPAPLVTPDALPVLWRQGWRGNARELETFLVRCFLLAGGPLLDAGGIRRTADRFGGRLETRLPLRGPRAREEIASALRTARAEGAPLLGRGAELRGCHPDTRARALRGLGLDRRALVCGKGGPGPFLR